MTNQVAVQVESALIRESVARLLHSDILRNSEAQRTLLSYLAEKSLSGKADQLKEYVVGIEAFGKPETYDPRKDSTVRMQCGKLRHKLAEYYRAEGLDDPVIIDLPKGGFKLVFDPNRIADVPRLPEPPARRPQRQWPLIAGLCAASALAASLSIYWWTRATPFNRGEGRAGAVWTPELAAIWQPFLAERPTVLCLGTPLFVRLSMKTGAKVTLRSAVIEDWGEASRSEIVGQVKQALQSSEIAPNYGFTGIGEAVGALELVSLLGPRVPNMVFERSSQVTWQEISSSNMIFLGPPKFNTRLKEIPVRQDLVMEGRSIRNLHPHPGEPAVLEAATWPNSEKMVEDYALITHMPGPGGQGDILVFAAVATAGTQAAVQYLVEPGYARDLVARLRQSSGQIPRYYQIVIRATFKDSIPLRITYLFHHVLETQ